MRNKFRVICAIMVVLLCSVNFAWAGSAESAGTMKLTYGSVTIGVGGFQDLRGILDGEEVAYRFVQWSSSDDAVATVDEDGRVRAVAEGTAIITGVELDTNKSATCEVIVKHQYAANHVCEICGEKYNDGKKIDQTHPYTTHVFCDLTEGCKICGEEVEFETNIYDISSWWDYKPNDVGVSPKPEKIYFHIKNGILGTLHRSDRYMLSCYPYVAHDEAWHEKMKKGDSEIEYVLQLIRNGEVKSPETVYPVLNEKSIEYLNLPDGRINVTMPALEVDIRYSSE